MRRIALAILMLLAVPALRAEPIAKGQIVDKVVAASDAEMTYAVYLPSAYAAERKWPVVFVLDPRRRGAFAAELFREAAEEYGWIVISSNNTESDSANAPNTRALQAMFADAPSRFSIDERRIYLAGFSGTANLAFSVAEAAKGTIAGVIGCSGWLPQTWRPHDPGFAWFGTAGNLDFNYLETRSIDERLASAHANHRVEFFAGSHRWAPKELLARSVAWMELQAMRAGTRPPDAALVSRLLDADVAAARIEPDALTATRRFDAIARTFDGLADVNAFRVHAAELSQSDAVKKALAEERRATDLENSNRDRLPAVVSAFLQSDEPPVAGDLARRLGINYLQSIAKDQSRRGLAAQRVLESIYAQVGYYLPQQVHGPKLVTLQNVAAMIHPPH